MPETITGDIEKLNKGQYGYGLQLKGRKEWFNQKKDDVDTPWDSLSKGDRIKVLDPFATNSGNFIVKSENIEILPGSSPSSKPGFVPGPDKDDAISWANALNVTATVLAAHEDKVSPDMVVEFARAIYAARPWAPQQPENGATPPVYDGVDEEPPPEAYSEDEAR